MKKKEFPLRDYSTISPSAKSLLFMKGHTNIPFARQTAELIEYPEKFIPDFRKKDLTFWARTLHFENRYWSVDQLMEDLPIKNILELGSGFSFRGLEHSKKKGYHYIDTDLDELMATKKEFVAALQGENAESLGRLELLPLNALDEEQFNRTVSRFPPGKILIVNEGLLMYLNNEEKEKLCGMIGKILKERGGYWITADIYIRNKQAALPLNIDPKTKNFFEQHKLEENKFGSFKEAEEFFKRMGFIMDKEANVKGSMLSSRKYLLKSMSLKQLFKIRRVAKLQATWRLRLSEG